LFSLIGDGPGGELVPALSEERRSAEILRGELEESKGKGIDATRAINTAESNSTEDNEPGDVGGDVS
jgi:hypothetical protein